MDRIYENFDAPDMAEQEHGVAVTLLRALCHKNNIVQADLARALGLGPTSLGYYFTGYEGRHLPGDKSWSEGLRGELVARGCTLEEAAELFGLQATQDIRDVQNTVNELRKDVSEIKEALAAISKRLPLKS